MELAIMSWNQSLPEFAVTDPALTDPAPSQGQRAHLGNIISATSTVWLIGQSITYKLDNKTT